jgi:phosphohistidine phosphatase SixA
MRHAHHEADPKSAGGRCLSQQGQNEVKRVGERLNEYLSHARRHCITEGDHRPRLGAVIYASTDEAKETASALVKELRSVASAPHQEVVDYLSPDRCPWASPYVYHWARPSRRETRRILSQWIAALLHAERAPETNAVLVVGHAPQVGWLAAHLTGAGVPIARAELLCIRIETVLWRPHGHLEWVLSPDINDPKEDPGKDLREKIKSKMESAKLLGAVLTGLLTFVIGAPKELVPTAATDAGSGGNPDRIAGWIAENPDLVGCFAVSLLLLVAGMFLFFAAYFAYDSLLMPSRFWAEAQPARVRVPWMVARPPASDTWVLYVNMMHIWNYRFVPATACAILAPTFLAYSMIIGRILPEREWREILAWFVLLLAVGGLTAWRYLHSTRPIVGSED